MSTLQSIPVNIDIKDLINECSPGELSNLAAALIKRDFESVAMNLTDLADPEQERYILEHISEDLIKTYAMENLDLVLKEGDSDATTE
jgi:hypothetical protein